MRERAELRRDRDVVIRLCNDRGFARERIAHQRQLVCRTHEERVETIDILERVIERDLERFALLEAPVQVAASALRIAVALEVLAELFELAPKHAGIGERTVVHEAPVL